MTPPTTVSHGSMEIPVGGRAVGGSRVWAGREQQREADRKMGQKNTYVQVKNKVVLLLP